MCYDKNRLKTQSFNKYLIPTAMDVPLYRFFVLEPPCGAGALAPPIVPAGVVRVWRDTEGEK